MDFGKYFKEIYHEKGIWFCMNEREEESRFSDDVQDELFEIEDVSWWFKYRANVVYHIAERYFDDKQVIFDVGGG